jgi:hypothetical protein
LASVVVLRKLTLAECKEPSSLNSREWTKIKSGEQVDGIMTP